MLLRTFLGILFALLLQGTAFANPNQFGSSGLLQIPTADTLDSSNICFGFWGNCSNRSDTGTATIMPVTLTLGLGTFWEVYGTYPNVFVSSREDSANSGRGTADLGTKLRIVGSRSSKFKLAADLNVSRYVDEDPNFNGVTDYVGRLVASLRSDLVGLHVFGGYADNGASRAVLQNKAKSSKEYPFGVGIEYLPSMRSKLTLETQVADAANTSDAPIEASLGFQYYLTPHLTLNLALGMGINDAAPDWRALVGLSTCQGVGSYIKPIPEVRKKDKGLKAPVTRPTKVLTLTPLLIRSPYLTTPASKFEVPLDADGEEMLIRPYAHVVIAQQPAARPVTLPRLSPDELRPEELLVKKGALEIEAVPEPVGGAVFVPAMKPGKLDPLEYTRARLSKFDPIEYTLSRVSGITPLYGVKLKGQVPVIAPLAGLEGTTVAAYRKFRLPDNLFEFDNAELVPEVQKSLSELAELMRKDNVWVFVRIDGHTDAVGSMKYNMNLSLKRAVSVADYLVNREGFDPGRIFVRGMGKTMPIADNATDEGRKLNRRFEIVLLVHKEKQR